MPSATPVMPSEDTFSSVRLRGRIAGATCVALPSGDEAVTFRVVIDRSARQRGPSGKVKVDAVDCIAWTAGARRRLLACEDGEVVEVEGWLQRRFWRSGAALASRTEVVVREVRRAASAR